METQGELTYEQIKFREEVVAKLRACSSGLSFATCMIIKDHTRGNSDDWILPDYDKDDSIKLEKLIQKIYTSYELCEVIDFALTLGWGEGIYCASKENYYSASDLWRKMRWFRGDDD